MAQEKQFDSIRGRVIGRDRDNLLRSTEGVRVGNTGKDIILTGGNNVAIFDDFLGDVIADQWAVAKGSDVQCVDFAHEAGKNGVLKATTGDDAAATMAVNGVQLHRSLDWQADQGGLVLTARVKLDAITAVALFVGFTDQIAALEMPFTLGGSDALTSNASDACGFLFDTGADTDTIHLVGVKGDTDATKQNSALAMVADTYRTFQVQIGTDEKADFYIDGVKIGSKMSGALTKTVPLTPVIAAFARGAASRIVRADFINVAANRV